MRTRLSNTLKRMSSSLHSSCPGLSTALQRESTGSYGSVGMKERLRRARGAQKVSVKVLLRATGPQEIANVCDFCSGQA